jgi:hypothetical protein
MFKARQIPSPSVNFAVTMTTDSGLSTATRENQFCPIREERNKTGRVSP